MSNNPLVSVICLCYNHADYVVEALNSVNSQTYPSIEIIIVDDKSNDDSKKIIQGWVSENPNAVFIANDENLGNTKSFNKALQLSKGEFIIDFATDDILHPDCVGKLLEKFQTTHFSNLGAVYCNSELVTPSNLFIRYSFKTDNKGKTKEIPTGDIYTNVIHSGNFICPVAMMVKKEVYETIGNYNENLAYEDLDFWIRSSRYFQYDYVDLVLSKKRVLENSLGSQYKKPFDPKARYINHSTYLILKAAFENTNQTKNDDRALLKRVHYEMLVCFKTYNFWLLMKYILLEMKLRLKKRES